MRQVKVREGGRKGGRNCNIEMEGEKRVGREEGTEEKWERHEEEVEGREGGRWRKERNIGREGKM